MPRPGVVRFDGCRLVVGAVVLTLSVEGCQRVEPPPSAVPPGVAASQEESAAARPIVPKEEASGVARKAKVAEVTPPTEKAAIQPDVKAPSAKKEKPSAGEVPAKPAPVPPDKNDQEPSTAPAAPRDLGPPLVDDVQRLNRLHPTDPVWFDKEHKSVIVVGEVCQRKMPLELFACLRGSKEHESIVSVPTKAFVIHAGLLAAGAEPGNPVRFYPEYVPARGPEIEVTVLWRDEKGVVQRARAQEWIRDMRTKKAMQHPWVFGGSQFLKDEQTGQQFYRADGEGDLICVSNFPSAVLDVPVRSSDANTELMFECFTERIPPIGTPVTLILTPKPATSAK